VDHLLAGLAAAVLVRVHALVGLAQRLGRFADPLEHHGAVRAADVEALAPLGQRGARVGDHGVAVAVRHEREDAELVAAHAVGATAALERGRQVATEALEQRIASRVAERVVVGLEAVEVEQREHVAVAGHVEAGSRLEVAHQRAPVAQPGERIRGRLELALAQHAQVLAEGEGEAGDDGEAGRGRQPEREAVDPGVVVDHEHAERHDRQHGRHDEHAPAAEAAGVESPRRLPGGEGEDREGGRPRRVEQRVLDVGADGGLVEVDRVADGEHDEAERDHSPRAARSPAGHRHDGEDERQHREVAERIAQVRGHRGEGALGARHDAEDERGAERRDRQRGDEPVEPQRPGHAARARAEQQHERHVRARVDRQVAGVGGRRVRGLVHAHEDERPVQVAGGEAGQSERKRDPRRPLVATRRRGTQAHGGHGEQLDDAVDVVPRPRPRGRLHAEVPRDHGNEPDDGRGEEEPRGTRGRGGNHIAGDRHMAPPVERRRPNSDARAADRPQRPARSRRARSQSLKPPSWADTSPSRTSTMRSAMRSRK
jgi:hypothetical protein